MCRLYVTGVDIIDHVSCSLLDNRTPAAVLCLDVIHY